MASDEERIPRFVHIDEQDSRHRHDFIQFGFENELKSITIRQGDSTRFEAKLRLVSTSPLISIDRNLLEIEWRLNDTPISSNTNSHYHFGSIVDENLYWMDIRHCEQDDEGLYTISISYNHQQFQDESSAYLFVDSESFKRGVALFSQLESTLVRFVIG